MFMAEHRCNGCGTCPHMKPSAGKKRADLRGKLVNIDKGGERGVECLTDEGGAELRNCHRRLTMSR